VAALGGAGAAAAAGAGAAPPERFAMNCCASCPAIQQQDHLEGLFGAGQIALAVGDLAETLWAMMLSVRT